MNVFCTLSEGDYHYGVAALLNSLIHARFQGLFVVGYRGAPPAWFDQLEAQGERRARIGGIEMLLEPLSTPWQLAHVKPRFMLDILDRVAPGATSVTYADPDIVVEAPWAFFESWMALGVAVCEDCNFSTLSSRHYLRTRWSEFLHRRLGVKAAAMDRYYNSGFVGVTRGRRGVLELWRKILETLPSEGVALETFKPGTRFNPFHGTDQDALNMALMVEPDVISALGPEGMGFVERGMEAMWHAADSPKPWRRFYFRHLLSSGRPIGMAHRAFWRHAGGVLKAWSPWELLLRRLDLALSVAASRFYHSA